VKKLLFLLVATSLSLTLNAQSGTIASNYVQIPKVTFLPGCTVTDKGKTVFNNADNIMYYCDGTDWKAMTPATSAGVGWSQTGNNINNTNTGRIGINTNNPLWKLQINHNGDDGVLIKGSGDGVSFLDIDSYSGESRVGLWRGGGYKWGLKCDLANDFEITNYNGTVIQPIKISKATSNVTFGSKVGINYSGSPLATLHVGGFESTSGGPGTFFYPNSAQWIFSQGSPSQIIITALTPLPTFTAQLGILSEYGIVSKTYVGSALNVIASDSRIKNIKGLSNNAEDLARLRKIEITNYTMRDEATWGKQNFKKVIAQQVESVYPEVIKLQTSVIPDIYSLAESVSYDAATKNLSVTLAKDYNIKIGDKLELVHPEKGKIQAEVISSNGKTFTVKDWAHATDKIFVFGREVNDFRSVDYEALSMLGISAIQALAKENEILKSKNEKIEARLETIENLLKANIPTGK
jgi:Chaperone of endosialidase